MINISEDDAKLFEQNGYSKEHVGATVTHYRQQGLSDDEIQNKINTRLSGWKNVQPSNSIQQPVQQQEQQTYDVNKAIEQLPTQHTVLPPQQKEQLNVQAQPLNQNYDSKGKIYYTDSNGNWIGTSDGTLYARWSS